MINKDLLILQGVVDYLENDIKSTEKICEDLKKYIEDVQKRFDLKAVKIEGELLEKLAEIDHNIWMETKGKQGYHNPDLPTILHHADGVIPCGHCHPFMVSYSELPEEAKELDRIRWRELDGILLSVGLIIQPLDSLRVD